jgi:hypothetical protein
MLVVNTVNTLSKSNEIVFKEPKKSLWVVFAVEEVRGMKDGDGDEVPGIWVPFARNIKCSLKRIRRSHQEKRYKLVAGRLRPKFDTPETETTNARTYSWCRPHRLGRR